MNVQKAEFRVKTKKMSRQLSTYDSISIMESRIRGLPEHSRYRNREPHTVCGSLLPPRRCAAACLLPDAFTLIAQELSKLCTFAPLSKKAKAHKEL